MDETLFPAEIVRDPDYHAACMLVAEIVGKDASEIELLPGVPSPAFCPIALTLDALYGDAADATEFIAADPIQRAELMDHGRDRVWSFRVDSEMVRYPWSDSLTIGEEVSDEDAEALLNNGDDDWEMDPSLDVLWRVHPISDDAWGPGCGNPSRFIERFDAGEFSYLHLEVAA